MRAYLDGRILDVDSGASWFQVHGAQPHQLVLDLERSLAQELFDQGERHGSKLVLVGNGGRVEWDGLTILGTGPSSTPYQSSLVVVDQRFAWAYGPHIRRSYNVPRKGAAVRRIDDDDDTPLALQQLADDLVYAEWSLKNGEAYTAKDVVEDLLNYVDEDGNAVCPFGWHDRDGVLEGRAGRLPPIQGLELDGRAAVSIGLVLAKLGGRVGLTVGKDKRVELYDRLSGEERELVGMPRAGATATRGQVKPRIVGGPLWAIQDRKRERPSKVRVLFSIAMEFRVDSVEGSAQLTSADTIRSRNMVQIPEDLELSDGRKLVQGTLLHIDDYLTYLSGKQPANFPPLTLSLVRKGWLYPLLEHYATEDGTDLGAARSETIRRDYRSLYQFVSPWNGRFRSVKAYMVSIRDQETGATSLSPCFMDYAWAATWRGAGSKTSAQPPRAHEAVRNAYANAAAANGGSIVGTPIKSLRRAPALVSIVDEERGVYRIQMLNDWTGRARQLYRSALTKDTAPSADGSGDRQIYLQEGELAASHEHSIVLTGQPAAPNDNRQLFAIDVTADDVSGLLPDPGAQRQAEGPVLTVRIPSGRELARFPWDDGRAADVVAAFASALSDQPRSLQDALGDPINLQVLRAIAESVAASAYTSFEDHAEGGLSTGLDPSLELKGSARSVGWSISAGGALSAVDLPAEPPPVDGDAYLPDGVRRLIDRFVDP